MCIKSKAIFKRMLGGFPHWDTAHGGIGRVPEPPTFAKVPGRHRQYSKDGSRDCPAEKKRHQTHSQHSSALLHTHATHTPTHPTSTWS